MKPLARCSKCGERAPRPPSLVLCGPCMDGIGKKLDSMIATMAQRQAKPAAAQPALQAASGWVFDTHGPGRDRLRCANSLKPVSVTTRTAGSTRGPVKAYCPLCRRRVTLSEDRGPR